MFKKLYWVCFICNEIYLLDPTFLGYPSIFQQHQMLCSSSPMDCPLTICRNRLSRVCDDGSRHRKQDHPISETRMRFARKQYSTTCSCSAFQLTLKLRWKFCTLTFLYGAVLRWHHKSKPSLAVISSTEMSWIAKRKMIVQIIPKVIFKFPSTISSAPIETNLTPLASMKSRALFTLAI